MKGASFSILEILKSILSLISEIMNIFYEINQMIFQTSFETSFMVIFQASFIFGSLMALSTGILKSPAPLVEHFSGASSVHLHFRILYGTLHRHENIEHSSPFPKLCTDENYDLTGDAEWMMLWLAVDWVEVKLLEKTWGGSWELWKKMLMRMSRRKITKILMRMLYKTNAPAIKVYNANDQILPNSFGTMSRLL